MATENLTTYWLNLIRRSQPVPEAEQTTNGTLSNTQLPKLPSASNNGSADNTNDKNNVELTNEALPKGITDRSLVSNMSPKVAQTDIQDDQNCSASTNGKVPNPKEVLTISRWWWGSLNPAPDTTVTEDDVQLDRWAQWFLYGNFSTVVDLLYKREDPENMEPSTNQKNLSSESNWFAWIRSTAPETDDSDEYSENGADLKTAKSAIESSKDTTHYAFKYGAAEELLLSVSETRSESQPVLFKSQKRPKTQNEIQELLLQPQAVTIRSSNSSIRSDNSHMAPDNRPSIPHIIFPSIAETFRPITVKTQLRLMGQHLIYQKSSSECHLYKRTPSKVAKRKQKTKRAVILGVHNFLPTKMVKTTIGQSTGNSIRFVKEASKAFRKWLDHENCEIETIALDGEGRVSDRVEHLLKLLENWYQLISDADFLFVVAHSHGVTIGIQVLAGLLERVEWRNKRIGFLSMAGTFHGPVVGLDTKLVVRAYTSVENEIIKELFDLQKPKSHQSLRLRRSLAIILDKNVKVTLCGSLTDQFVPLFSALATGYSHPNLYRIFHTRISDNISSFLVLLFQATALAKNMGLTDHNLIQDLSERCVGSLSSGGHGHLFEDKEVYGQALQHALETTDLFQHKELEFSPLVLPKVPNPYQTPWKIRGLLHDILQLPNNPASVLLTQLMIAFKQWHPAQRQWKDLKYALEAFEEANLHDFLL